MASSPVFALFRELKQEQMVEAKKRAGKKKFSEKPSEVCVLFVCSFTFIFLMACGGVAHPSRASVALVKTVC